MYETRCIVPVMNSRTIKHNLATRASDGASVGPGGAMLHLGFSGKTFFLHKAINPPLKTQQETAAFTFLSFTLYISVYILPEVFDFPTIRRELRSRK